MRHSCVEAHLSALGLSRRMENEFTVNHFEGATPYALLDDKYSKSFLR